MPTVIVASTNPVKVRAVEAGFRTMFPGQDFVVEGVSAQSGVPDQPISDKQTLQGAYNRAEHASQLVSHGDYWVGLEGGVEEHADGNTEAFAWIVVKAKSGATGRGKTGTFTLPPRVAELVRSGKELGEADDIVFGRTNSKQDNGAIGLLTNNIVDRATHYARAVVLALIPFQNPNLYGQK